MSFTNISASPIPAKMSDGTTYLISPLTSSEVLSMVQAYRKNFIQSRLAEIPKEWTAEDKLAVTKLVYEEAKKLQMDDGEIWENAEVVQMIIYFAIHRNHPSFTMEEAKKRMENLADLNAIMATLNGENLPFEAEKKTTMPPTNR